MKKQIGPSFKLTIKVNAPIGGRAGTTAKLLEKLMNDTECFTVNSLDPETNILNITYHELSYEEFINVMKKKIINFEIRNSRGCNT
jgi:hypothetical protein